MPNILIRGVPGKVLASLKQRAARRRRSLQQELLEVLRQAADDKVTTFVERMKETREKFVRQGRLFSDSTPLIREDRAR